MSSKGKPYFNAHTPDLVENMIGCVASVSSIHPLATYSESQSVQCLLKESLQKLVQPQRSAVDGVRRVSPASDRCQAIDDYAVKDLRPLRKRSDASYQSLHRLPVVGLEKYCRPPWLFWAEDAEWEAPSEGEERIVKGEVASKQKPKNRKVSIATDAD